MKQFFTKYLPVSGEIKNGEIYLNRFGQVRYKKYRIPGNEKKDREVKLFLCSRDIKVGDKVFYDGTDEMFKNTYPENVVAKVKNEEHKNYLKDKFYVKLIGEVSPEAIWVKEGDEFCMDDIRLMYSNPFGFRGRMVAYIGNDSCCHFH